MRDSDGGTTLYQLLREGTKLLADAGDEEAALDARELLLEAFHMDGTRFLLERMKPLRTDGDGTSGQICGSIGSYRQMLVRRARREPLAYITGRRDFMGMTFMVNEHVLIPRQDTETLAELVLADQKDRSKKILDLCTGSGCIAVSLAALGGYTDVTASDLSPEALRVAAENARIHLKGRMRLECGDGENAAGDSGRAAESEAAGHRMSGDGEKMETAGDSGRAAESEAVGDETRDGESETAGCFRLFQGDLFDALPPTERYDILVSNPPYIPTAVIETLQPEVRDHEPRMALDGLGDGLEFYRRIAREASCRLNPGAWIYLEIGCDQAEAAGRLLAAAGFCDIKVFKDLPGLDRVVRAAFRPEPEEI